MGGVEIPERVEAWIRRHELIEPGGEVACMVSGGADSTAPDTLRGTIRDELLPALRKLHPAAERNIARLADERPRLPRALEDTLLELLGDRSGSRQRDLGSGITVIREYDTVSLAQGP